MTGFCNAFGPLHLPGPEAVHLVTSSAICDGIFAFGDRNKDELEIEIRIAGAARGFRWKIRLRRCNGASAELPVATSIVNLAGYSSVISIIIHPISFQIPLSYLIKLISSHHLGSCSCPLDLTSDPRQKSRVECSHFPTRLWNAYR
jgi:hypothetical protein